MFFRFEFVRNVRVDFVRKFSRTFWLFMGMLREQVHTLFPFCWGPWAPPLRLYGAAGG